MEALAPDLMGKRLQFIKNVVPKPERVALLHAVAPNRKDPVIARLIDKITVNPDPPPYPDRFAHHHGATVTITLQDGRRFFDHVDFPRGSARGIAWADVDAKYSDWCRCHG